jgi:hypothetical protein
VHLLPPHGHVQVRKHVQVQPPQPHGHQRRRGRAAPRCCRLRMGQRSTTHHRSGKKTGAGASGGCSTNAPRIKPGSCCSPTHDADGWLMCDSLTHPISITFLSILLLNLSLPLNRPAAAQQRNARRRATLVHCQGTEITARRCEPPPPGSARVPRRWRLGERPRARTRTPPSRPRRALAGSQPRAAAPGA